MSDDKKPNIFKTAAESIKTRLKVAGILPSNAKWCPHTPSEKQQYFLDSGYEEVLMAGSRFGGKTGWLLMAALKYVDDPQYRAIIFRINFTAFEESQGIKEQLDDWLKGTGAVWSERKKQYKFPSGAILRFGSLVNKKQLETYRGGGYHFVGVDQLEQIPEYFYRFIFTLARRTKKTQIPVRVWSTANASHFAKWIKNHFIEDAEEKDDIALLKEHSNDQGHKWTSVYAKAGLEDNPGADIEDYKRKVSRLNVFEYKQQIEGDWDVLPEGDIYPYQEAYSVIKRSTFKRFYGIEKDAALVPRNFELGNSLDWGSSREHVTGDCYIARPPKDGLLSDSLFIFRENVFLQPIEKDVADWKELNEPKEEERRYIWRILSHEAKTERDTLLRQYRFHFTPSSGHRTEGISAVRDHLVLIDTDKPHPFNTVLYGRPRLYLVVEDTQGELIRNEYAKTEADKYCVTPPRDHEGLIECRSGLKRYKWGPDGHPEKVLDDMADAIRFLVVKMTRFPKYIAADPKDKSLPVNLQMPSIAAATPAEQPDLYLQRRIELAIVEKIRRQQTKKNERVPVWQRRFFGG